MRRYGFDIVAMWEAATPDRTEFVYLLAWSDETVKQAAWERFMAGDEWKEIKRATSSQHGNLVGAIEERTLVPTSYSRGAFRAAEFRRGGWGSLRWCGVLGGLVV